jgi:hypothetical protein
MTQTGTQMTSFRPAIFIALIIGLVSAGWPVATADAQWVFVARKVIGRVEQLTQQPKDGRPGYDFASVVLDAPASRVYATAISTIRKNQTMQITSQDAGRRRIDIANGDRTASLSVTMLSDNVSQLTIAGSAGPGEDSTTSRVVAAVLRVCQEMHKRCSAAG